MYALDATNGDEIWTFKTGDVVTTHPALAYGNLYIGSDDDTLYAFGPEPEEPSPISTDVIMIIAVVVVAVVVVVAFLAIRKRRKIK